MRKQNKKISGTQRSASIHRAGTREVHNKLEKNRRAHLKECFEQLKRQLPQMPDEKKTSNLLILSNASKYISVSTQNTTINIETNQREIFNCFNHLNPIYKKYNHSE